MANEKASHMIFSRNRLESLLRESNFNPEFSTFDHDDVPDSIINLIHYVEIWGNQNEQKRVKILLETPPKLVEHLINILEKTDVTDRLDNWLASDLANGPEYSDSYIAFSAFNATLVELPDRVI